MLSLCKFEESETMDRFERAQKVHRAALLTIPVLVMSTLRRNTSLYCYEGES